MRLHRRPYDFAPRNSPSIRPKICAGPLHSILPTIDMSKPMQEAVPALVVGSVPAPD